jgi:hypothetical protein
MVRLQASRVKAPKETLRIGLDAWEPASSHFEPERGPLRAIERDLQQDPAIVDGRKNVDHGACVPIRSEGRDSGDSGDAVNEIAPMH